MHVWRLGNFRVPPDVAEPWCVAAVAVEGSGLRVLRVGVVGLWGGILLSNELIAAEPLEGCPR